MKGATLFSGIGAPECAAPEIDWLWGAEIDPFASAVHEARIGTPNLGDMTAADFLERAAAIGLPDLIVAGSPCQDFSVAGLRAGLDGDRGNLTLEFIRLIDAMDDLRRDRGERGLVGIWENVPGVLSHAKNAFGCILAALAGSDAALVSPNRAGWSYAGVVVGPRRAVAWRRFDAQYFGLAQRRARVFAVFGPRGWPVAEALFPLGEGLRRDTPPGREAREDLAPTIARGSPNGGRTYGLDADTVDALIPMAFGGNNTEGPIDIAFDCKAGGETSFSIGDKPGALRGAGDGGGHAAIAFSCKDHGADADELAPTLRATGHAGSHANAGGQVAFARGAAVRRIIPREAERLQGFPDDWTAITYRGKPAADGPRYKALGNAMAVPVMRWILLRIVAMHALKRQMEAA